MEYIVWAVRVMLPSPMGLFFCCVILKLHVGDKLTFHVTAIDVMQCIYKRTNVQVLFKTIIAALLFLVGFIDICPHARGNSRRHRAAGDVGWVKILWVRSRKDSELPNTSGGTNTSVGRHIAWKFMKCRPEHKWRVTHCWKINISAGSKNWAG